MSEQQLKKMAIPTGVDVDLDTHSLIVHYEQQTVFGDADGKKTRNEKKPMQKVIKLGNFKKDDINELADELLRTCNLINPQRRDLLVKALMSLVTGERVNTLAGDADIDKLEEYIDAMYDDMQLKLEATSKILQLCQQKKNLAHLASNDVLMSALGRCLRDDGLKSIELGTNIAHCFFIISHFQNLGPPLLVHKAPESLFKMIDQECKRYQAFYQKLSDMRNQATTATDSQFKEKYQTEYDKFKRLISTQDQLLYVALQTIMNLTEISETTTGQIDLFWPMEKLINMLGQVLTRKPPNTSLVVTVVNYLKRISIMEGGVAEIQKANVLRPLIKLLEGEKEVFEPVIRLAFNLSFNPGIRAELGELDIYSKLDSMFLDMNNDLMTKYQTEYDINAPLAEKLCSIIKNHSKRQSDDEIKNIMKRAALVSKFIYQLADDDIGLAGFQKTAIGQNLTAFACLCPEQDETVIDTLKFIASDAKIAQKIIKNNLLTGLTAQFERTKDPVFMTLFTDMAAAIPPEQTKTTKGNQQALFQSADKVVEMALQSGDEKLKKAAMKLMFQAPASSVKVEQAQQATKLAIDALDAKDDDIENKISAVGVISMMMSRAKHVQLMCDNGDLKKLPDQLISMINRSFGKTNKALDKFGLDFSSVEFDLLILTLICVLKAMTYKMLRQQMMQMQQLTQFLVRLLFNQNRQVDDKNGWVPDQVKPDPAGESGTPSEESSRKAARKIASGKKTEGDDEPKARKILVVKSQMDTVERKATHIVEVLADLILDIIMFSEPTTADAIRAMKFNRYNYEFAQKLGLIKK